MLKKQKNAWFNQVIYFQGESDDSVLFATFPLSNARDYEHVSMGKPVWVSGVLGVAQASFSGSKHPSFSGPIHVLVDPSKF